MLHPEALVSQGPQDGAAVEAELDDAACADLRHAFNRLAAPRQDHALICMMASTVSDAEVWKLVILPLVVHATNCSTVCNVKTRLNIN